MTIVKQGFFPLPSRSLRDVYADRPKAIVETSMAATCRFQIRTVCSPCPTALLSLVLGIDRVNRGEDHGDIAARASAGWRYPSAQDRGGSPRRPGCLRL